MDSLHGIRINAIDNDKRLGENGRRAIAEEFNFEADVDALVTVEERALKRQDSQIVEA